jgi:hypothetical protein
MRLTRQLGSLGCSEGSSAWGGFVSFNFRCFLEYTAQWPLETEATSRRHLFSLNQASHGLPACALTCVWRR